MNRPILLKYITFYEASFRVKELRILILEKMKSVDLENLGDLLSPTRFSHSLGALINRD